MEILKDNLPNTVLLKLHNMVYVCSTRNFAHAQTLSRMSSLSGCMNIARVKIGFFTGFKKIKQRRISFVLGYLRKTTKNEDSASFV
jgi:hypothetical protein